MDDLRYPIGKAPRIEEHSTAERAAALDALAALPGELREAVEGLSVPQLDTAYRPGGWTVRQVVHHLPDSHLNAYTRFKLGLTEEEPLLRTYEEQLWAELPEARSAPIELSLALLQALHERWVLALRALPAAAWQRTVRHPGWGAVTLDGLLAMYVWHGRHHVAHITRLRERLSWPR
jgi:DinB superfamily